MFNKKNYVYEKEIAIFASIRGIFAECITGMVRDNCCHEFEASEIVTNQTRYIEQESWY